MEGAELQDLEVDSPIPGVEVAEFAKQLDRSITKGSFTTRSTRLWILFANMPLQLVWTLETVQWNVGAGWWFAFRVGPK